MRRRVLLSAAVTSMLVASGCELIECGCLIIDSVGQCGEILFGAPSLMKPLRDIPTRPLPGAEPEPPVQVGLEGVAY